MTKASKQEVFADRANDVGRLRSDLRKKMDIHEEEIKQAINTVKIPRIQRFMKYLFLDCMRWRDIEDISGHSERYLRDLFKPHIEGMK